MRKIIIILLVIFGLTGVGYAAYLAYDHFSDPVYISETPTVGEGLLEVK